MWKDYSKSFIRNNRSSSISVMIAAFISALFLSLLCSLFFNIWKDEVRRIILEEGDWQGRIAGEISDRDLTAVQNFANVDRVVVHDNMMDVYFSNPKTIYRDLPFIAGQIGAEKDAVTYHELLLSRYLIHAPQDETTPLLLTFYLILLGITSISLILIIHNSFAVSMNARIHQFGIFSSIGATPGQILTCLMQEAAILCVLPILLGNVLGIALSFSVSLAANKIAVDVAGSHRMVFSFHPFIFVFTILITVITVLFSAWIPARKLSSLTPLEAIRGCRDLGVIKRKSSRVLFLLFGIEGELAGNSLRSRRAALRTTMISLTLAFFGFSAFLCFSALSSLSVKYTYTERYKDSWDIMATMKDTAISDFTEL